MDEAVPKRRWYRKKRWWAAIALWLLLPFLYAASVGPAMYAKAEGRVSVGTLETAYAPLEAALARMPPQIQNSAGRYVYWWESLAGPVGQ